MKDKPAAYMASLAFIQTPPDDAEVVAITPTTALGTRRTSTRLNDLVGDYRQGRQQGQAYLDSARW